MTDLRRPRGDLKSGARTTLGPISISINIRPQAVQASHIPGARATKQALYPTRRGRSREARGQITARAWSRCPPACSISGSGRPSNAHECCSDADATLSADPVPASEARAALRQAAESGTDQRRLQRRISSGAGSDWPAGSPDWLSAGRLARTMSAPAERRRTTMANKLRCRLGRHKWRCRGRGDALTYFCQVCGTTRDKPPRWRTGGSEAPWLPGTGGDVGGGG